MERTHRTEQAHEFGFETRQVHAGQRPDPNTGARAVPIYQTASYVFEDPESAAAYFNLQEYGNTYSRIMNPDGGRLRGAHGEPRAGLRRSRVRERHRGAGRRAVHAAAARRPCRRVIRALRRDGESVQASAAKDERRVDVGRSRRLDEWKAAVRDNTKAFYGETIGNPGGNVLDIETIAALAHEHNLPLIVDNTFATPYLCRPIEWGADIVVHSATKFIGGHGTSIGGVVVDSGTFNWSNGRFPVIAEPSPAYHGLLFHETFGTYGYLMKLRAETLRDLGAAMSPFNAFLFLQGLETLSLRMERHVENAMAVANLSGVTRARVERHLRRPGRRADTSRSWRSTCRAAPARCSRSNVAADALPDRTLSAASRCGRIWRTSGIRKV